jgi:hypothetical protein
MKKPCRFSKSEKQIPPKTNKIELPHSLYKRKGIPINY